MVHENWRYRPYYREAGRWLGEQRIGRVVQVHMSLLASGLVADAFGAYPALVRQPFLNTLDRALVMEILIHHIDTLRFLLGMLRLVHSDIGRGCEQMRGEDRATLLFKTEEGAPVTVVANLAAHGEPASLEDHLILLGERGTIRLAGDTLSCHGEEVEVRRYDAAESYRASYAATIAHFVDALRTGAPFETGPRDNLQTLALVEAIYAGARSDAQCAL
jgi:predicted dehydrogenase